MAWTCPRCGGELLDPDKAVCDGCIAEEVAIMFENEEADRYAHTAHVNPATDWSHYESGASPALDEEQ